MIWDDSQRICPNCKTVFSMPQEVKLPCPSCGKMVWFFNFCRIAEPPKLPEHRPFDFRKNPTVTAIAIILGILSFAALISIATELLMAAICLVIAIGAGGAAFLGYREAKILESELIHAGEIQSYAELLQARVGQIVYQYNTLLRVGDVRIETYYQSIYVEAERLKQEAYQIRAEAMTHRQAVADVEHRIYRMAQRLVDDHLNWTKKKLRPDPENYQRTKLDLIKAFDFVESVGYRLPTELREGALSGLKLDYQEKNRNKTLKEEQQRIQRQMREEEKIRRERDAEVRKAESQEREMERRLNEALAARQGVYDGEIEKLQRELADAHAQSERAKSMAQLTKAGHVYILSNIGSFGENIFKVGMTRRLEPADRVKELGDASVPFPFDVHAMISCDDAPSLENSLHRLLTRHRVNRVNLRKEYFSVDLETILQAVRQHHGHIEYVAEAAALEYRESQTISPDQLMEIESELVAMGADFDDEQE
jgi:predicted RNA-binding Zn-ribbon protein involved in translation (DUF1610 family)